MYISFMNIEILETHFFIKQVKKENISENDIDVCKKELKKNPEIGDIIPQSGGLRKVRVSIDGKGKRGGARIVYLYIISGSCIYLLHIYKKTRKENITNDELKTLRKLSRILIEGEK